MAVVVPLVILALIAAAGAAQARHASTADPRHASLAPTADGWVQGRTVGGTNEFLGLPYAARPAGSLRWRPPQPAARWDSIREAARYAPHCPQPPSGFGVASTSENCLYLNAVSGAG